ncbi:MAG: DUF3861 domain-containing protein, partial [Propionivibrio sp.]|nr:DUF3861 domain-containing protein [Propionivibrio sp.]
FEVGSHDDIFAVVERVRQRGDFSETSATAFGVGLKLFSEVMLENRDHPLFAEFRPHFAQFMRALKQGSARVFGETPASASAGRQRQRGVFP